MRNTTYPLLEGAATVKVARARSAMAFAKNAIAGDEMAGGTLQRSERAQRVTEMFLMKVKQMVTTVNIYLSM